MNACHIVPRGDIIEHDTSSERPDCICGPSSVPVITDDGGVAWIINHHSLDGREFPEGGHGGFPAGPEPR